jgi:hypothetical protein
MSRLSLNPQLIPLETSVLAYARPKPYKSAQIALKQGRFERAISIALNGVAQTGRSDQAKAELFYVVAQAMKRQGFQDLSNLEKKLDEASEPLAQAIALNSDSLLSCSLNCELAEHASLKKAPFEAMAILRDTLSNEIGNQYVHGKSYSERR